MLSLLVHAALGVLTVAIFLSLNAHVYREEWADSRPTFLEGLYLAAQERQLRRQRWRAASGS